MDERVQNLFNKVRATADSFTSAAGSTARYAGKKAGNTVSITRLNVQIYELQREVNVLLQDAGQIIYNAHLGSDTNEEMLEQILTRLDERNGQIMELRGRIDSLRNLQECPACGAPCSSEDRFCKTCGEALKKD